MQTKPIMISEEVRHSAEGILAGDGAVTVVLFTDVPDPVAETSILRDISKSEKTYFSDDGNPFSFVVSYG